jgi:hypothetical protein
MQSINLGFSRKALSEGQTFVINFALASPVRVEVDNLEKLYNKLRRSFASFSNLALSE